jgi:hypothetical protein
LTHGAKVQARPSVRSSRGRDWSLEAFKSEWTAHRVSTTPADRAAAEEGVIIAYWDAGLAPPRIIWCDGPVELAIRWASAGRGIGDNARELIIDRPHRRAKRLLSLLPEDRMQCVRQAFACDASHTVSAAVHAAVIEAAGAIRPSLFHWMRGLKISKIGSSRRLRRSTFGDSGWSQHELCRLAPYEHLHEILQRQRTSPLCSLFLIAKNAGWFVPHERTCWLADRPDVLRKDRLGRLHCASGPALRYRDGWEWHAYKGVAVPPWIIRQPEKITMRWIDAQIDPRVRHAMIDILTPERFIDVGGADHSTTDESGTLWRRKWSHRGVVIDAWAAIDVASSLPDGSVKRIVQSVPAELRTLGQALRWFSVRGKSADQNELEV